MLQTNSTNTAVKMHMYKAGTLTVSFSFFLSFYFVSLFFCFFASQYVTTLSKLYTKRFMCYCVLSKVAPDYSFHRLVVRFDVLIRFCNLW